MTLENYPKKQEALILRENGMKLSEIVNKTGLSKATLKRLFNHKGLVNEKLSLSHNKNESTPINDPPYDKKPGVIIISEPPYDTPKGINDTSELKTIEGTKSSKITVVNFDTKNGTIEITQNEDIPEESMGAAKVKSSESSAGITEKNSVKTSEHPNLNDIEPVTSNPLDGVLGMLIPIGLVGLGMLCRGKKGSKNGFREEEQGSSVW